MLRRPPVHTRTDNRFPYTTLFRSVADLLALFRAGPMTVELSEPAVRPAVDAAAARVAGAAAGEAAVYGINTGFGKLARERIPPDQVTELQRRLVLSHARKRVVAGKRVSVRLESGGRRNIKKT